jgi:hypothetical protein
MVFIVAPIENTLGENNAELVVKIENELVPIQEITELFVSSNSYAKKPKVFFFLDFNPGKYIDEVSHNYARISFLQYTHY